MVDDLPELGHLSLVEGHPVDDLHLLEEGGLAASGRIVPIVTLAHVTNDMANLPRLPCPQQQQLDLPLVLFVLVLELPVDLPAPPLHLDLLGAALLATPAKEVLLGRGDQVGHGLDKGGHLEGLVCTLTPVCQSILKIPLLPMTSRFLLNSRCRNCCGR